MKKALFIFGVLLLGSCPSWGLTQNLQCQLVRQKSVDVFLDQELNLTHNPRFIYKEEPRRWALQIGQMVLDPAQASGATLNKRSRKLATNVREYSIWVNKILRFQFEVDFEQGTVVLYWWGTGRRAFLADFSCTR
ncbi:MAG: hypothetical protein ACK5Y2_05285 [Bdellovibrionales bacterium]